MSVLLGFNAKLYYLTTGTRASWGGSVTNGRYVSTGSSNLSVISNVQDLEVPTDFEKFDSTTRASGGIKTVLSTLCNVEFDIPMLNNPADTALIALETAHVTRGDIALAVLDGDKGTSGTKGIWGDFKVTKDSGAQKLGDAQVRVFSVAPSGSSTVALEFVKVT